MAKKYMKVVTAFQVQANDLILSSLCTSSFPNCVLHPSQLDTLGRAGKLTYCLQKELGKCKTEHETGSIEFNERFIRHFFHCPYKLQSLVEGTDIKVYFCVKKCMNFCFPKLKELNIKNYGTCPFNCYEKHIHNKKV
jgi:hypothetical protein